MRRPSRPSTIQNCGGDLGGQSDHWNRSSTNRLPINCFVPGLTPQAFEKARSMLTSFRQFIEDNKDEIEALQGLVQRPYRAGLKFRQVKELAAKLEPTAVLRGR